MSTIDLSTDGLASKELVPGLQPGPYAVEAIGSARLYHTQLNNKQSEWTYSGLKGSLIFGIDVGTSELEKYWFRLVDVESGRIVWVFKLPSAIEYQVELPFFHVFRGRSRRYGFLFDDDNEAMIFEKKVASRIGPHSSTTPKRSYSIMKYGLKSRTSSISPKISSSEISMPAPRSFVHIAHIGVNSDGIFEISKGLEPSWKEMLGNSKLQVSNEDTDTASLDHRHDFIKAFWRRPQRPTADEGS